MLLVVDLCHHVELVEDVFDFPEYFAFWVDVQQSLVLDLVLVSDSMSGLCCDVEWILVERLAIAL